MTHEIDNRSALLPNLIEIAQNEVGVWKMPHPSFDHGNLLEMRAVQILVQATTRQWLDPCTELQPLTMP